MVISCIVPIFNGEKYIEKCINSILQQTFQDFEVILVDDGSKDRSGKIIDELSLNDSRIIVIHKENEGVSSARNTGIKSAKGEWITFIDADDWVEQNYFEILVSLIQTGEYDYSVCSQFLDGTVSKLESDGRGEILALDYQKEKKWLLGTAIIRPVSNPSLFNKRYVNGPVFTGPVGKLYNRAILIEKNICFDSDLKIGEDNLFNLQFLMDTKKGVFIDLPLYHYRLVDNSAFHDPIKKLSNWPACFEKIFPIVEENNLKQFFYQKVALEIVKIISSISKSKKKTFLKTVRKFCRNPYCKEAIKNVRISNIEGIRTKTAVYLLKFHLCDLIYLLYKK